MHSGLAAFGTLTVLSKLGRYKISPTRRQIHPHCISVVTSQLAHYSILEWFGFHLPLDQVAQGPFELFSLGEFQQPSSARPRLCLDEEPFPNSLMLCCLHD